MSSLNLEIRSYDKSFSTLVLDLYSRVLTRLYKSTFR